MYTNLLLGVGSASETRPVLDDARIGVFYQQKGQNRLLNKSLIHFTSLVVLLQTYLPTIVKTFLLVHFKQTFFSKQVKLHVPISTNKTHNIADTTSPIYTRRDLPFRHADLRSSNPLTQETVSTTRVRRQLIHRPLQTEEGSKKCELT